MNGTTLGFAVQQHQFQQQQQNTLAQNQSYDSFDEAISSHSTLYQQLPLQTANFSQPAPPSTSTSPTTVTQMPDPHKPTFYSNAGAQPSLSCDPKPRLTKTQHEKLEAYFQENNKPNTKRKKEVAVELGVAIEKINNWFQNRRAKSKQDIKKLSEPGDVAGVQPSQSPTLTPDQSQPTSQTQTPTHQMELPFHESPNDLQLHHHSSQEQFTQGPDVSALFNYSDAELDALMNTTTQVSSGMDHHPATFTQSSTPFATPQQSVSQQQQNDFFNNFETADVNALSQQYGSNNIVHGAAMPQQHAPLQSQYSSHDDLSALGFSYANAPMNDVSQFSYHDGSNNASTEIFSDMSSVPSSGQSSVPGLDLSNTSPLSLDDWDNSRSSSFSSPPVETYVVNTHARFPQQAIGKQFQAQEAFVMSNSAASQEFQQMQNIPGTVTDVPMEWPSQALSRRESSQTMSLAQDFSNVALQTPQPVQEAQFKAPAPRSSSIVQRRKRPSPLPLVGARSQSYNSSQPTSPGSNDLRHMRSYTNLSSVSQGRIQKLSTNSAPRSPLNRNFSESMVSPRGFASRAGGSLAPPTPRSPREMSWNQQSLNARAQYMHPSIDENTAEHYNSCAPTPITAVHNPIHHSPPQTPMGMQGHAKMLFSNFPRAMQDTPPQSAPATQTTFGLSYLNPHPSWSLQGSQIQEGFETPPHFFNAPPMTGQQLFQAGMNPPVLPSSQISNHSTVNGVHAAPSSYLDIAGDDGAKMHNYAMPHLPSSMHTNMMQLANEPIFMAPPPAALPSNHAEAPMNPPAALQISQYQLSGNQERLLKATGLRDHVHKDYTFANQGPEHFEKSKKPVDVKPI